MAEKTEKATPKKLRDARKKGQVAKSQDFPSAFTFVTSIAATLLSAGYIFQQLSSYIISSFKSSSQQDLQTAASAVAFQGIMVTLTTSLPIAAITAIVGIVVNFLVIGPVFSGEALKPDIKRLNPVTNIRNLFKVKTLVELIKSILKISGAVILIYSVIWGSLQEVIATAALPPAATMMVFNSFLVKVIIRVGIFFLVIAIFDLFFQKRFFEKEMKMEKFEVRQEYKDTEGDPHLKSRRRHLAQEIAYQEGPSAARRARAIITNPVHIAIAIEYHKETEPAPKIVTMGAGTMAEKILEIAISYNIPIMRNVELAQTLYQKGQISDYIPEETYQAVAEILKWIERMEAKEIPEIFK
ncbi:MAG: EscU/YscU/HrcU family type III secretion system export apparatus switch protein [Chlamydiae bacterium GWC2_50_10]|nr:MAG: EscU/YscU/HrcU family type III secretion system export apparatus switch protein [Chlamydiae bacterium GWF2_49_8]OGN54586.1 MAG: EscU/YscU/HrcU family type III secretion system export apparatus switch protein [Chlamydiae bacterium GWC2_50_10]OGN57878.1 MAG: EscU/YscU/HrcU family type III secretion system export apparatus switch protein [Chlamydiae bacterium RIFCSPHIGHO2_02_FULL_49_29]OGN63346.1 MAG: EscU/YscU/HrcU family type III secretion system export apparatus switch protein [Chlamydia